MSVTLDFICAKDGCEYVEVNVPSTDGNPLEKLEHCGLPMTVSWNTLRPGTVDFEAFTTKNIHPHGEPITIRGKGDLAWAAREFGVRNDYNDPDLVAEGTEIRRKYQPRGRVFSFGS